VALRAQALGLDVRKPEKLTAEAIAGLRDLRADALVVVAYGLILPAAALAAPRLGCFNIHASLLPRQSSARSSPAMRKPASRSCAWTPGSTPVPCC
jgi:methionyl-tRNA formyltransferase